MDKVFQNINILLNKPIFHVNEVPITIIGIIIFFFIIFIANVISRILRKVLNTKLVKLTHIDKGISYALQKIIHYTILVIGVAVALQFIGVNLGGLAVIGGFLGVGIGFGLKNITSNFISGLILLFERPVSVGDRISVGDYQGDVIKISMRATTIKTPDNVSIIVPNSYFIEQDVINWSHGDKKVRIHIPVGVAYGSDVEKVTDCLLKVASEHERVMKEPVPNVWFKEFGDSSLNFELLVWIYRPEKIFQIKSDLNYAIDSIFRKEDIEIPFPQSDLHLKSAPATVSFTQKADNRIQKTEG